MAAADAGDRIVVDDLDTRVMQAVEQLLVPCHEECGMRLARRGVLVLDSNVQLLRADPEPDTAARAKGRRLLDLVQSEQPAEEAPGLVLAAGRRRELDVIDGVEHAARGYASGYTPRGMAGTSPAS